MYPTIALEGLDGSGKTAIGVLLADRLKGVYLKTPLAPFNDWRWGVDSGDDYAARFYFYLAAVISATREVARQSLVAPVIIDRWIYSTIANHRALGVNTDLVKWKELAILRPTYSFLLTTSSALLAERLAEREKRVALTPMETDRLLQERVLAEFRQLELQEVSNDGTMEATLSAIHDLMHRGR